MSAQGFWINGGYNQHREWSSDDDSNSAAEKHDHSLQAQTRDCFQINADCQKDQTVGNRYCDAMVSSFETVARVNTERAED
jgi:hypothetical protein